MELQLQQLFDLIEQQRVTLQDRVLILDEAQRDWAPKPETWSVRRIVEHLVLSDETLGQLQPRGAVGAEPLMFRIVPRSWRRAMILRALDRDTALPLPSPAIEPRGETPLPGLLSRWDKARGAMGRALETLRGDEQRYSHPVLGPLTAVQMLELDRAHNAYHTRQIDALQNHASFPVGA